MSIIIAEAAVIEANLVVVFITVDVEEIVRWKVRMTIYGSFFQRANLLDRYPAVKKVNYTLDDHDER